MLRTKLTLSTLAATIVLAGCSTQMTQPTQKDVSATKVEAVKAVPEIDLGAKNGTSVSVNLNFAKTNSPFGIKSVYDGFDGLAFLSDLNSKVIVKLHRYTGGANENPSSRFDSPVVSTDFDGDTFQDYINLVVLDNGLTGIKTFKLNGLSPNTKYYVSARAYTSAINLTSQYKLDIDTAGLVTPDTNSPVQNLTSVGFDLNDIITIDISGPKSYRVTDTSPLTVVDIVTNAAPLAAVDGNLASSTFLERDVVSYGDLGGVAASGNGQGVGGSIPNGGGTAGGLGVIATPDTEEFIQVDSSGAASIQNDITPPNTLSQNAVMDLYIQLKQDKKPQVLGEVQVNVGNTDSTFESISNP